MCPSALAAACRAAHVGGARHTGTSRGDAGRPPGSCLCQEIQPHGLQAKPAKRVATFEAQPVPCNVRPCRSAAGNSRGTSAKAPRLSLLPAASLKCEYHECYLLSGDEDGLPCQAGFKFVLLLKICNYIERVHEVQDLSGLLRLISCHRYCAFNQIVLAALN